MSRVRINPYAISRSAKELANYLGIKRLKVNGSRFIGRSSDIVINWGSGKGTIGRARQINKLENIQLASNKLTTLQILYEAGVSVPMFSQYVDRLEDTSLVVARTTLYGHSGEGVVVGSIDELPPAPLYVEYIEKIKEYRAIVVGDKVVDIKQKRKKLSPRDSNGDVIEEERIEHDEYIWNLGGGYIFAREGVSVSDTFKTISIASIKALGLDFGAVDIIEDSDGKYYVLEVNTAFGLEGQTIQLVGDAIKEIL